MKQLAKDFVGFWAMYISLFILVIITAALLGSLALLLAVVFPSIFIIAGIPAALYLLAWSKKKSKSKNEPEVKKPVSTAESAEPRKPDDHMARLREKSNVH
jgi:flagellar biosynthesis component FlhA